MQQRPRLGGQTHALNYLLSLTLCPTLSSYLEGGESHRVAEAGQGILLYAL